MKHKCVLLLACILGLLLVFLSCQKNTSPEAERILDEAISDMDLTKVAKTQDIPVTFSNRAGDTIICHCLLTEYSQSPPQEAEEIHWKVIRNIIDPETADAVSERTVSGKEALLCHKGDRAFLCWTLTAEYSFVIEYSSSAVTEEEIIQMAESIPFP